jgi:hypothetical protein
MKSFNATLKVYGDDKQGFGLRFPADCKPSFNALCKEAKRLRNGFVTIKVTLPRRYKSTGANSQNSHFHGHCNQIALETGNEFGTVKEFCKSKAVSMGYEQKEDDQGNKMFDLYGQPIAISFADATTEDASIAIEATHVLAADLGIILREE